MSDELPAMERLSREDGVSPDIVADNIRRLREFFPEVFADGKIDFGALKQELGEYADDREERYSFTWHGKSRARQIAQMPSTGTLRPCPEESVNWDTTKNIFIEGDNLEVLKLLQKSYHRKVKMIYIDPPYNTGKEFIYPDKWQDNLDTYLRYTGQVDDDGFKLSANAETSGRYHTNWLNMMYPRLKLARNLLQDDGVIFISIDDHEVHNLRHLLDEIFGAENHAATFVWKRKAGGGDDSAHVATEQEYILCYGRDYGALRLSRIEHESPAMTAKYNREENGRRYYLERLDKTSLTYNASMDFDLECPDGTTVRPPQPDPARPTTIWRWSKTKVDECRSKLVFRRDRRIDEWRVYTRTWESLRGVTPRSLLVDKEHGRNRDGTQDLSALLGPKVFSNPKPVRLLTHLLRIGASEADALVVDFFAGSGSLGDALLRLNAEDGAHRRFLMVQLPEPSGDSRHASIAAICAARLRAACTALVDKLGDGNGGDSQTPGFRLFRLSNSNIKPWDANFNSMETDLVKAIDNIKADRSEDDVLYELLLKYGLDLAIPSETRDVEGRTVTVIGAGALVVCLADDITLEAVSGIAALKAELSPEVMRVVFKDSCFADDVAKTNAAQILKQAGIDDVKSL